MHMTNMTGLVDSGIGEMPQHSNNHRKARDGRKDQGRHFVSMVRFSDGRTAVHTGNQRHFSHKCTNSNFLRQNRKRSMRLFPPKTRENTDPNPIQQTETRRPPAPLHWAAPALGQGPPRHQHYPPQARIHAHRLRPVGTCKYSPSQSRQQKGMASQGEPQYPRQRGPSRLTKF